ncbi:type II secretion system protein [Candidatus Azambacteria bacterium]|nr:type II secretion system protein [Candidatus Azambacteria bacterium]
MKKKEKNGFTLVEILVAVAIISSLSFAIILNIRAGTNEQAILRSAQKFAFNLRKAQNLALSPQRGVNTVCYYGVNIQNSTQYSIYYHEDANPNCPGSLNHYAAGDNKIETITLDGGVEFANAVNQDVAFETPEPLTYFFGVLNFPSTAITLRLASNPAITKNIIINRFGNVEIK